MSALATSMPSLVTVTATNQTILLRTTTSAVDNNSAALPPAQHHPPDNGSAPMLVAGKPAVDMKTTLIPCGLGAASPMLGMPVLFDVQRHSCTFEFVLHQHRRFLEQYVREWDTATRERHLRKLMMLYKQSKTQSVVEFLFAIPLLEWLDEDVEHMHRRPKFLQSRFARRIGAAALFQLTRHMLMVYPCMNLAWRLRIVALQHALDLLRKRYTLLLNQQTRVNRAARQAHVFKTVESIGAHLKMIQSHLCRNQAVNAAMVNFMKRCVTSVKRKPFLAEYAMKTQRFLGCQLPHWFVIDADAELLPPTAKSLSRFHEIVFAQIQFDALPTRQDILLKMEHSDWKDVLNKDHVMFSTEFKWSAMKGGGGLQHVCGIHFNAYLRVVISVAAIYTSTLAKFMSGGSYETTARPIAFETNAERDFVLDLASKPMRDLTAQLYPNYLQKPRLSKAHLIARLFKNRFGKTYSTREVQRFLNVASDHILCASNGSCMRVPNMSTVVQHIAKVPSCTVRSARELAESYIRKVAPQLSKTAPVSYLEACSNEASTHQNSVARSSYHLEGRRDRVTRIMHLYNHFKVDASHDGNDNVFEAFLVAGNPEDIKLWLDPPAKQSKRPKATSRRRAAATSDMSIQALKQFVRAPSLASDKQMQDVLRLSKIEFENKTRSARAKRRKLNSATIQ